MCAEDEREEPRPEVSQLQPYTRCSTTQRELHNFERLAALTRMCGLRVKVEPAPANPLTNKRVDFTVRGLLANGGVLYGDTVVTSVTLYLKHRK